MFCKIFQTFSTQNLAGQLHILQSLTNVVKNFFPTFSTDTIRIYSTAGRNAPRRTCPPPDSGRGRGPSDTSYRKAMTQETMGGAGVEGAEGDRNGVPPEPVSTAPGPLRAHEQIGVNKKGIKFLQKDLEVSIFVVPLRCTNELIHCKSNDTHQQSSIQLWKK